VDEQKFFEFAGGTIVVGPGYLKLSGSTVYLTGNEYRILCALIESGSSGKTVIDLCLMHQWNFTSRSHTLVNSYAHTLRKKVKALTADRVTIGWNRRTRTYSISVF
jgi:DNA-binding response OmpR family regulator